MDWKTKARVILVIVMINILFASIVRAQEMELMAKKHGGRGYFMLGSNIIDINNLNSRLESKGYPKFSNDFISFGGGGYKIIDRVIIGGEGHGLFEKEVTKGNYEAILSCGYGFFNLGYLLYSQASLNIYPILGLGGGGITLRITEKGAYSFDEVLANPKRGTYLSTGGFLLNLGVGTDYLLKLGEDKKVKCGLVLGVRIGYIFAPIKGDWKMDGIDISKGPDIGITGPYIRFMIGGGGILKDKQ